METLIEDTLIFLKCIIADKETPESIKGLAVPLLNSWEYQAETHKILNEEK
jgi:hypothetical protein